MSIMMSWMTHIRQGKWGQAVLDRGWVLGQAGAVPAMAAYQGGTPRLWRAAVLPPCACSDPSRAALCSAGLDLIPSAWPSSGCLPREWLYVVCPWDCFPWGWDACPSEALAGGWGGAKLGAAFTWPSGAALPDPCHPGPLASLPTNMGPSGWPPTVDEAAMAAGCRHGNPGARAPLGGHHPNPPVGPLGHLWS